VQTDLAERLGSGGLATIDATLLACTDQGQHKVARIIARALDAGGFPPADDYIAVHARRLIGLANTGTVVIFGKSQKTALERGPAVRLTASPRLFETVRAQFCGISTPQTTRPGSRRF
jgi:hypothetical protein